MTQSAKAARDALYVVCQSLYAAVTDSSGAPTLVAYGKPGSYQPQNIVAVTDTRRPTIERPTMGPARSRRARVEIDVIISIFVPGTEVAQQVASDQCDDMATQLETYFRTSPNETLGGSCFNTYVSAIDGPRPDVALTESGSVSGRIAESTVTVTAQIDY